MYSGSKRAQALFALMLAACAPAVARAASLRVCADPNNLPFSNERGEGFENEIAKLLARELQRPLEYTWWPQRRGFLKNTLDAGRCDVVIGVPANDARMDTTRPYYTSTYVIVTRNDLRPKLTSIDDPRLHTLRIGIHTIGDDYGNVPPMQSLARRGIVRNIKGYPIYGAYSRPDPPRNLIDALSRHEIDAAIAWGPLAGYFSSRESEPLEVQPIAVEDPGIPLRFPIAVGVRHDDQLRDTLDRVLAARVQEIQQILRRYGVPLAPTPERRAHVSGEQR